MMLDYIKINQQSQTAVSWLSTFCFLLQTSFYPSFTISTFHLFIPPNHSLSPSACENSSKALFPHTLSHTHTYICFRKKRRGGGGRQRWKWRQANERRWSRSLCASAASIKSYFQHCDIFLFWFSIDDVQVAVGGLIPNKPENWQAHLTPRNKALLSKCHRKTFSERNSCLALAVAENCKDMFLLS